MAISPRILNSHLLNYGTAFVLHLSGNLLANISNTFQIFQTLVLKEFTCCCFLLFFVFLRLGNAFYFNLFIFGISPGSKLRMVYLNMMKSCKLSMQSTFSHFLLHFPSSLCSTPHSWLPLHTQQMFQKTI